MTTLREVGLLGDWAHRGDLVGGEPHRGDVGGSRERLDVIDGVTHRAAQDGQFHDKRVGVSSAGAYALAMGSVLDERQIEQYHRDGFLVIEGFVDKASCDELKAAANQIVADFQPSGERTIFTTSEQERVSNGEFLASGSGVWCFFEEEAFDDRRQAAHVEGAEHQQDRPRDARPRPDVREVLVPPRAGRRRGRHRAGRRARACRACTSSSSRSSAARSAAIRTHVPVHRSDDGHRVLVRHRGRHAARTVACGPSRAAIAPRCASCSSGPARPTPTARIFEELDPTPLPSPSELVPLEVPAGTMVILHGLLPHWSDINRSPKSRHAYSLHCISAAAEYPEWNWLQRSADMPLRSLAEVAGIAA